MQRHQSFNGFVTVPENRAAIAAVQELAASVSVGQPSRSFNPLCLHGPPGCGKSYLVKWLIKDVTRRAADVLVCSLAAEDFDLVDDVRPVDSSSSDLLDAAKNNDILVIEDLQHLNPRSAGAVVRLIDFRLVRGRTTVITSRLPPQELTEYLPTRLTSRLAGGLVACMEPLPKASRLVFLEDRIGRRRLPVSHDAVRWLADHVNGSLRMLEGTVNRLEALARANASSLDVASIAAHFQQQVEATRPTLERIVQRVGSHFKVEPRQLQSRRRYWNILWPRQIGMYLARRLAGLSLEQIGAYFGGRDHATVLHACRKVEERLRKDEALCGAVRQLQANLA